MGKIKETEKSVVKVKRNQIRLLPLSENGKENVEAASKIQALDNLEQIWVTKEETANISIFNEDVCYIVDPFDDEIVPHIVSLGYPVIGPQCALTLAKHNLKLSSQMEYPVSSLTMRGILVCFSNVVKAKRMELTRLTKLMGGMVTRELTDSTTHLVVNEVGSVKYFKACEMKIPVVTTDWIEHLWKHGQTRYICAKDTKWENFACPIFLGCSVCTSGFASQRTKIARDVETHGGSYSGEMRLNEVTHLIAAKPEGQKFMYAKQFGAKAVDLSWLYTSIQKGWCQDSVKFPVKRTSTSTQQVKSSSPKDKNKDLLPDLGGTSAANISSINLTHVNETVNATFNDPSSHTFLCPTIPAVNNNNNILSNIPKTLFDGSDTLDGIGIYLVGFTSKETEQIKQLISANGGTKYDLLTSSVTHVVVGVLSKVPKDVINSVKASCGESGEVSVVWFSWVLDCLKKSQTVNEDEHWVKDIIPCPSRIICSKDENASSFNESSSTFRLMKFDTDNADNDLLSQYGTEADGTYMESKCEKELGCFYQKFIFLSEFSEKLQGFYERKVKDHGGIISTKMQSADFVVQPIISKPLRKDAVSDFWLEKCIDKNELFSLDEHLLFKVILVPNNSAFNGKSFYLSGFENSEVKFIVKIINAMGGSYSENLSNVTHVLQSKICSENFRNKIVVSLEWLFKEMEGQTATKNTCHVALAGHEKMAKIKQQVEMRKAAKLALLKQQMKNKGTPMSVKRKRHKKFMESLHGVDSPGKIFQPGYKPKFNFMLDDILKHLQTPEKKAEEIKSNMAKSVKENKNMSEYDLDEIFEFLKTPKEEREKVKQIIQSKEEENLDFDETMEEERTRMDNVDKNISHKEKSISDEAETFCEEKDETNLNDETFNNQTFNEDCKDILKDAVIYISKKTSLNHREINSQIKKMGAEVIYQYSSACTHFIIEGKGTGKDYKSAKSQNKIFVSPYWIGACMDAMTKVDERLFLPTYNPDKSIQCETRSQDISSIDSQKARDDFKKTVEHLMLATKNTEIDAVRRLSTRNNTPTSLRKVQPVSNLVNSSSTKKKPAQSQDIQVEWDDPTGRAELERLKQAEENNTSLNTTDMTSNISVVVQKGETPVFLFSGIKEKKQELVKLVESLGGKFLESNCFDSRCTHVIVQTPDRREKYFCSTATGKWTLHVSYLDACRDAGHFVREESFEYGDSDLMKTLNATTIMTEATLQLIHAPRRWRLKLQKEEEKSGTYHGAFHGWVVIILLDNSFAQAFSRIISSGSGVVVSMSWPYDGDLSSVTHVFVDSAHPAIDALQGHDIYVCKRQYIGDYLLLENCPSPSKYLTGKREGEEHQHPSKKTRVV